MVRSRRETTNETGTKPAPKAALQKLVVSRREPLPIHLQLAEQLRYQIEDGSLAPDSKLPTVRELAKELNINYNTIRAVYVELERQGYIRTEQGRGSFVSGQPPRALPDTQGALRDIVDEALARAQAAGVSTTEFARMAYTRAKLFAPPKREDVRLLFAECNKADVRHFGRAVAAGTGIEPTSILLSDLHSKKPKFFSKFDLLVTTLPHVCELQELAGNVRPVIGMIAVPSYQEVLADLSKLPEKTPVALVCTTGRGARTIESALVGAGLRAQRFIVAGMDDPEKLERARRDAARIYVSRTFLENFPKFFDPHAPNIHAYESDIDVVSLRFLRRQIARVRTERQQAAAEK